jgi:prepilin-type N-terminal cleavage/methylation domain-containing protein
VKTASRKSDRWQVAGDTELRASRFISRHPFAFTLIELLAVITILGIIAGLAVPALKELGKSNSNLGASQQLLADLGHARQLAIANHTTVYMVFVPTNFWVNLPPAQLNNPAVINLCDKQLTGYTFIANGAAGDQPGRHNWHYLAPWLNLPAGTFIAQIKFQPRNQSYTNNNYIIYGFDVTNGIPFPFETNSTPSPVVLPYIAFNYLGQLVSGQNEYIPLAHGSVLPAMDPATKMFVLNIAPPSSPTVSETPPGNSSSSSFNIIDIDWLTGRATLQFQKVQ